jgi:hypothetical protein
MLVSKRQRIAGTVAAVCELVRLQAVLWSTFLAGARSFTHQQQLLYICEYIIYN